MHRQKTKHVRPLKKKKKKLQKGEQRENLLLEWPRA
jgi:hypothetical protein